MASTNPARGMRDSLPADVRKREYVINIIKQVYESYGYEPLETPAVENIETLMGKYGEEGNQLIFKILKRGEKLEEALLLPVIRTLNEMAGQDNDLRRTIDLLFSAGPVSDTELREYLNKSKKVLQVVEAVKEKSSDSDISDLALRYDLTVPLARVVADRRNDLPKFFKRYQIQPVWRADRPARGRFREFYQCDVDVIGSRSVVVEAEIISAAADILTRLGFDNFIVRVNHRKLLSQMVADAGIENETEALVALDKLDKIGADGVRKELVERGISESAANMFLAAVTGKTSNADLDELLSLCNSDRVKIDPSLARGLSYYTGTIIEINVPELAGSLGGGGRYDGLIGMFGKEQIPACGFSLGLERILVVMDERGMFPPEIAESTPADVMVTLWSEETAAESLKLASELRSNGLRVTVYPEPDKFGKQMKYADSIRVPFVCVLGENEIAENKVTLKNMKTGEQKSMERDQVYEELKKVSSS